MDATKARETVRALEAKALSTTFEGERTAFLAKADALREKYNLPKRPEPGVMSDAQRLSQLMAEAAAQVASFRYANYSRGNSSRTTTCGWCGRSTHTSAGHGAWERAQRNARASYSRSNYSRNSSGYAKAKGPKATSTHCKHGHDWATNATTDSRGSRVCKACKREASRRAAEKKARGF